MSIIFNTATTVNGYLADDENSLQWLFDVGGDEPSLDPFLETVSVLVMGSTTYEWILEHENLLTEPEKWTVYFDSRPMFVFSTRELPVPDGADVRVVNGPVERHLAVILAAAGGGDVWVQGGGDLAGQFLDAGALDRIVLSVAPVFLGTGAPLLPRTVLSDRLELASVEQVGRFAVLTYDVTS
ncbi:MAG TPA: dihydrofolate reductase family protein [Humibacter sp.]|nr:dihydrofolate reductase family protein [Humibacter sp.]